MAGRDYFSGLGAQGFLVWQFSPPQNSTLTCDGYSVYPTDPLCSGPGGPQPSVPPAGGDEINFKPSGGSLLVGISANNAYSWVHLRVFDQNGNEVNAGIPTNDPNSPKVCQGSNSCRNDPVLNPHNKNYLWIYTAKNLSQGTYQFRFYINCNFGCPANQPRASVWYSVGTGTIVSPKPSPTITPGGPTLTPTPILTQGTSPAPTTPNNSCGKVCMYSQIGADNQTQCFMGNCLDRSQNCDTNVNCGYNVGCSSGQQVNCQTQEPIGPPQVSVSPLPPQPTPAPPSCQLLMGSGDISSKVDIVLLPENYSNWNDFQNDANQAVAALRKTNLGTDLYKLNVWALHDLSQNYYQTDKVDNNGTIWPQWDINNASTQASRCGGDVSLIIYNNSAVFTNRYFGITRSNLGTPSIFLYKKSLAYNTVPHELGHAIAKLSDEYPFPGNPVAPFWASPGINCSNQSSANENIPCPKWANFTQTGCYAVCGWSNFYRPSITSVMNKGNDGSFNFNQPSLVNGWDYSLKNYQ